MLNTKEKAEIRAPTPPCARMRRCIAEATSCSHNRGAQLLRVPVFV